MFSPLICDVEITKLDIIKGDCVNSKNFGLIVSVESIDWERSTFYIACDVIKNEHAKENVDLLVSCMLNNTRISVYQDNDGEIDYGLKIVDHSNKKEHLFRSVSWFKIN